MVWGLFAKINFLTFYLQMNNIIAQTQNPDRPDLTVADRFEQEDHTGKVPVDHLFDKTETILSNMERQRVIVDQFNYDPDAKL